MHEQRLRGVADAHPVGLGVEHDRLGHRRVGGGVDVDVAVADAGLDHRHGRLADDALDQRRAAARDDDVDQAAGVQQLAHRRAVGGQQLDEAGRQPGLLRRLGEDGDQRGVGAEGRRRPAQQRRVAALEAEPGGVDGHVRAAPRRRCRPRPSGTRTWRSCSPLGSREPRTTSPTGSGRATSWRSAAATPATRPASSRSRSRTDSGVPSAARGLDVGGVGGQHLVGALDQRVGHRRQRGVLGVGGQGAQHPGGRPRTQRGGTDQRQVGDVGHARRVRGARTARPPRRPHGYVRMILMSSSSRPLDRHRLVAAALLLAGRLRQRRRRRRRRRATAARCVAGFYPLEWAAARVGGDRVAVVVADPARRRAARPRARPRRTSPRSPRPTCWSTSTASSPRSTRRPSREGGDHAWDAGRRRRPASPARRTSTRTRSGEEEHATRTAASTRTSGSTRPGWPTSATPWPTGWPSSTPTAPTTYEQNAAALRADLEALDAEMSDGPGRLRASDTLVTSHDAFGYLADRYGLDVVGHHRAEPAQRADPAASWPRSPTSSRERGVTTVYTETLVDPAVAETVADEAGVRDRRPRPARGADRRVRRRRLPRRSCGPTSPRCRRARPAHDRTHDPGRPAARREHRLRRRADRRATST